MKKLVVAVVLLAGVVAVAYASFTTNKKKAGTEKKTEKKTKDCSRTCIFS
jgi:hypothetical protein